MTQTLIEKLEALPFFMVANTPCVPVEDVRAIIEQHKSEAPLQETIHAQQAELESKLAQVEKDADRYNWLCDNCVDFEEYTEGDSFIVKSLHFEYSPKLYLHQAIDAAIQESKKGGAV